MTNITQGRLSGILEKGDFGTPGAELSAAAVRVLDARYLCRDANGKVVETPLQMFERVARAVAAVESKWCKAGSREQIVEETAKKFYEIMASLRFLPNSPTLMNAGRSKGQLSACFVLPISDNLRSVFETLRDAAIIHKTGGGTGFNFGHLRPAGDLISSSAGYATGPVGFLKVFDAATGAVKQGGARRGANMAVLPIDHPDVGAFIESKLAGGITNFNLSVGISDAFMDALKRGAAWDLTNPRNGQVTKSVPARRLWRAISEAAWATGDPGIVFLDRINDANPTPELGRMESTNPCGEQPLLAYESCNLGSLNLLSYVSENDLNWQDLERDIHIAVRFLDNIIEANSYPLLEIEHLTLTNRKVGLGVMGWADVLMAWRVPYDSDEAITRAGRVMERVSTLAVKASERLAAERGAFPGFKKSRWAMRGDKPRRNATVTTIAPTGTISIIAGVSSGIEPVFSLAFEREALEGERFVFIHPALKSVLSINNIRSRKVLSKILETGFVSDISEIPRKQRRSLKTATEIKPIWHVRMQGAFQKHVENGVSKTINLPRGTTVKEVGRIYELAHAEGCKGITVFREASKDSQILRRGIGERKARQKDLFDAIDWLLDDGADTSSVRKKTSVGLASLSRAQLKRLKR